MLVGILRRLVDEPDIVSFITDQNRIEIGEHLEISYYLVDLQIPYLEGFVIPIDREYSNCLFLPSEVEGILLFAVFEDCNDLMMRKFGVLFHGQILVIENDLVASHEANGGKSDDFQDHTDIKLVIIDGYLLLNFLRFEPNFLHVVKVNIVVLF